MPNKQNNNTPENQQGNSNNSEKKYVDTKRELELFDLIVKEVYETEPDDPDFDALYLFLEEFLSKRILAKYALTDSPQSFASAEDLKHDLYMHIMLKVRHSFFDDEKRDKTCGSFKAWINVVAKHFISDFGGKVTKKGKKETPMQRRGNDDDSDDIWEDVDLPELNPDGSTANPTADPSEKGHALAVYRDIINLIFGDVIKSRSKPHILINWLLVSSCILFDNKNRIEATRIIDENLSENSLNQLFEKIVKKLNDTGWFEIPDEPIIKIWDKLAKTNEGSECTVGEMKFKDFFMAKGAKASISDWYNKVNIFLKKEYGIFVHELLNDGDYEKLLEEIMDND